MILNLNAFLKVSMDTRQIQLYKLLYFLGAGQQDRKDDTCNHGIIQRMFMETTIKRRRHPKCCYYHPSKSFKEIIKVITITK